MTPICPLLAIGELTQEGPMPINDLPACLGSACALWHNDPESRVGDGNAAVYRRGNCGLATTGQRFANPAYVAPTEKTP